MTTKASKKYLALIATAIPPSKMGKASAGFAQSEWSDSRRCSLPSTDNDDEWI